MFTKTGGLFSLAGKAAMGAGRYLAKGVGTLGRGVVTLDKKLAGPKGPVTKLGLGTTVGLGGFGLHSAVKDSLKSVKPQTINPYR